MTESSDIQQARDALKHWLEGASPGPWATWPNDDTMHDQCGHAVADGFYQPQDAVLILGTAGNPDLLDAIDAMLRDAIEDEAIGNGRTPYAEVFAAAIVSANERMTSAG